MTEVKLRNLLRYALTILLGTALGVVLAIHVVRTGAFASDVRIGPWQTGRDFGSADASARTRAVVALRGLLALPAKEARYYTADTDSAGRPLDGRCRYRVAGGSLPARWWSLTLYDPDGYLVANPAGRYSVESAAVEPERPAAATPEMAAILATQLAAEARWAIRVAPSPPGGSAVNWIPTGGLPNFQLTLRLYLPITGVGAQTTSAALPTIVQEGC